MVDTSRTRSIFVLAGTNGAGKSSVAGAVLVQQRIRYFNPDDVAARIRLVNPWLTNEDVNSVAWSYGKRLLERAIAERLNFAFETTLGGKTILLESAMLAGLEVRVTYLGLSSPELHIERVRARVAMGGHDIPDAKIRERYDSSRLNLIRLMPKLSELRVYDNSHEASPSAGASPEPALILHMAQARIIRSSKLADTPGWAKPILLAAIRLRLPRGSA